MLYSLRKRINLKLYLLLNIIQMIISCVYLYPNKYEIISVQFIFLGIIFYQLFMIKFLVKWFDNIKSNSVKKREIIFFIVFKTFALAFLFYLGIQLIHDRIIIVTMMYTLQIAILTMSVKRNINYGKVEEA